MNEAQRAYLAEEMEKYKIDENSYRWPYEAAVAIRAHFDSLAGTD